MDLFTYLMNKNGKNLVDSNHLLEYLLSKSGTEKEVSGTEINITDVTKAKIIRLTLDKESTQDGTPSPSNPVEIKTVKGYRNLFDGIYNKTYTQGGTPYSYKSSNNSRSCIVEVKPNTTYTISKEISDRFRISQFSEYPVVDVSNAISYIQAGDTSLNYTLTTASNTQYLVIQVSNSSEENVKMQITEGTEVLPYVPYGTNWIYTKITNGTDTNYFTIPLNDNEIAGIGTYKDEYIVDKNGHCWLNKKTGKVIFTGVENWDVYGSGIFRLIINDVLTTDSSQGINVKSDYYENFSQMIVQGGSVDYGISARAGTGTTNGIVIRNKDYSTKDQFNDWLSTHNTTVYYASQTSSLIDLNYTVDIRLFNGVNNITNSDDMDMTLIYK